MRIRKRLERNGGIKSGLSSQKVSERLREWGAKERRNEGESVSEVERK